MFNRFRSIFALSRLPLRTHSHLSQHPNPTLYRVRFLRPAFTKNRVRSAIFYTACIAIYWNVVGAITLDDDEDGEEEENETQLDDAVGVGSGEDGSMFIPLGLTRQTPAVPYKRSDPEWREIVSLLGNGERLARLRSKLKCFVKYALGMFITKMTYGSAVGDLAAEVFNIVMGAPAFNSAIGKEAVLSHWWFDIAVPLANPPGFERGGLEITDDHIIWTTRPVTPLDYGRLRQVLWPSSMALSLWASFHALLYLELQRVKSFFNIGSKSSSSNTQLSTTIPLVLQRNKNPGDEHQSGGSSSSQFFSRFKRYKETSPGTSETAEHQADSSKERSTIDAVHSTPQSSDPPRGLHAVITTFMGTLMHTWQPPGLMPSAGTIVFTGLVQIHGQRAICTIDVNAAYNPKTNTVDRMLLTPRYLQSKRLPIGSPN
ncbi:MAG: hypothetical protein M1835_006041 [Candelina submexicana]|nr:MAG: hypothetical protein M1835_006041 [Candelina submexicana]